MIFCQTEKNCLITFLSPGSLYVYTCFSFVLDTTHKPAPEGTLLSAREYLFHSF